MKSRKIIFFLILFLHFFSINAQNQQTIDSLYNELKIADDTTEINLLNEIAELYVNSEPDSTLRYVNIAKQNAKTINFENGLAYSYLISGDYYYNVANFQLAETNYNKALEIYERLNEKNNIALVLISKASLYVVDNDYVSAFDLLNKAKSIGNENTISYCNYSLAYMYSMIEDYDKAMLHIISSLKFYETNKDSFQIAHCNNFIGDIYLRTNRDSLALTHFTFALNIYKNSSKKDYAYALGNVAIIKNRQEKYEEAIELYLQTIKILKEVHDRQTLANNYINIGNCYLCQNNFQYSKKSYFKADSIYRIINDSSGLAKVYKSFGDFYEKTDNSEKAIENYNKSIEIADRFQLTDILRENYYSLYEIYQKQKKHEQSNKYILKYLEIKDTIYSIEQERTVQNLMISYETEKKEQEIRYLNNENFLKQKTINSQNKIKYFLIFFLIFVIISAIIIFVLYNEKNKTLVKIVQQHKAIISAEKVIGTDVDNKEKLDEYENNEVDAFKEKLAQKIIVSMEEQQLFLNPDINLTVLSDKLDTNNTYISKTINEVFNSNFNNFVNNYRIKFACRLLSNKEYERYTISAISKKSGFNNSVTFISAFKKITGVTPSFYIKNLKTK